MEKIINILGQDYKLIKKDTYGDPKFDGATGIAELYSKELIISNIIGQEPELEHSNIQAYENKVIRHEMIHAFFHESGLTGYCNDEYLVEWLSQQAPKIFKAMKSIDVL